MGCLGGAVVKGDRRCSARRACLINRSYPHKSRNVYMDYFSTVAKKISVSAID